MKKVKKILIILLIVIIALVGIFFGGKYALIKYLSGNDKINELVDKAAEIVSDEKVQREIETMVNEMIEDGTLNVEELDTYMEYRDKANQLATPAPAEPVTAATPAPTKAPVKGKTRTERILNAMAPSDAAFARSMFGRINLNHALSLWSTDQPAAKAYIKSCLSSGEISRALGIYSKYSYLLKEIK